MVALFNLCDMHREEKVTAKRVRTLVHAFVRAEIESLRPNTPETGSGFFNIQLKYIQFAHTIARKIYNARNHKFTLKSAYGDVEIVILMGSKILSTVEITIEKGRICYRKV